MSDICSIRVFTAFWSLIGDECKKFRLFSTKISSFRTFPRTFRQGTDSRRGIFWHMQDYRRSCPIFSDQLLSEPKDPCWLPKNCFSLWALLDFDEVWDWGISFLKGFSRSIICPSFAAQFQNTSLVGLVFTWWVTECSAFWF